MWSALEGSILLWVLVLGGLHGRRRAGGSARRTADPLVGWALVVMFVVDGVLRPRSASVRPTRSPTALPGVTDGPGPNPLLQNHVLVLFHPPILYLGYVGFTVPFAFAIAALVTGRVGEGWLMETRRWALFAWAFLTIGILLGGWWSYEVLGWSGVWAWDPVENASFLPWLTGTAYIHSVLVQERRGMLRVWNLSLLVATFSLTILGTFLTRSGVLSSVHAFGDGPVGAYLLGVLRARRRRVAGADRAGAATGCASPGAIDSPVSREGAFLANNVLFTVFAFVVLLGTVFPLLVEALQDRRTVVGAPYFDRLTMPIGLVLLFLMAVAPGAAVAQGQPASCCASGCSGRRGAAPARSRSPSSLGADRLGAARRVRPRRLGRRLGAAPARAGHPPPGLARPRRAGQRRHDRAPRRDPHRRRPGRVEQLHPLGDAGARRRRAAVAGAGTRSSCSEPVARDERRAGARASRPTCSLDGDAGVRAEAHQVPAASGRTSARRACAPG